MLPRALIGDIKPENWLGFIDAIYAIILTLLLIELPSSLLDLIKEYEQQPDLRWILLNSFMLSLFGYLAIFIIVYDIWAHHRVIVVEAALTRINLSLGILILFLCSLVPPVYHVVSTLKHEALSGGVSLIGEYSSIFWEARLILYLIIFSVYGFVALIAAKDLRYFRRREGEAACRMIALKQLKDSSIAMVLSIVLISFLSLMGYISPPAPLVLIALCTHLPVDRLMLTLKRRIIGP